MKSFIKLAILVILFGSCKSVKPLEVNINSEISIFEKFQYHKDHTAWVSVHRGGGELPGYPENCIESFEYISKKIPCIIECDIELTSDSVMVLMHDKTLDRTTNGTGSISQKTFKEINSLFLKDNFGKTTPYKIPTLENTLEWGRDKVIFTLDVKKTTPFSKVIAMVEAKKANNYAAIITYNANEAAQVFNLSKNVLISVSIMQESDYERLKLLGIPDKNMVAFIGTREPKPDLIEFLHQKGIKTILGVLGNLDKKAIANQDKNYLEYLSKGVDIFATDRPEAVYKQIELFKSNPKNQ